MEKIRLGDIYNKDTAEKYCEMEGRSAQENPDATIADRYFDSLIPKSLRLKTVLDHGCGNGRYCEIFARNEAERIVGIDLSPAMIDAAKKRDRDETLEFACGDIHTLPFPDGTFDFIFSRFSLVYSHNIEKALSEIGRVSRNDGVVLMQTNAAIISNHSKEVRREAIPLILKLGNNAVRIQNFAITMQEYRDAIERAGLEIITEDVFPATEISISDRYEYRTSVRFEVLILKLRKMPRENT